MADDPSRSSPLDPSRQRSHFLSHRFDIVVLGRHQGGREMIEVIGMGAETTATMVVWPKRCGHGGKVLELVEHFRPYWLVRHAGHRVVAAVPEQGHTLSTGMALARPATRHRIPRPGLADWKGRQVTVLRYAGCILSDREIEAARAAGVIVEVVDVNRRIERSV